MNTNTIFLKVRDTFWFLPAVYSVISLFAVFLVTAIDFWMIPSIKSAVPSILLTNTNIAKSLYSALITSILTMTTISFSTIMVVLTTYSTQFSPRTLQDFMKSRLTQHVMGVYSFGFIFSLLNLLLLNNGKEKGLLTPFFTVMVAIACLAFFVLFIHHSSRFVQVNNLIGKIRKSTSNMINQTFSNKKEHEASDWDEQELDNMKAPDYGTIYASQSGYMQNVEMNPLINWAKQHNVLLEANFQIGDYIQKSMPLFKFWKQEESDFDENECNFYVMIGNERTDLKDIEFSIQKLVEISVKAISPSINDPHTAANCINRIGSLLAELGERYEPIRYYSDDEGALRFIMEPKSYQEYLYKSFYQIRTYGSHDLSVINGVMEALYKISVVNKQNVKDDVWRFAIYMDKVVDEDSLDELDHEHYRHQIDKLKQACNKS
ncbi:DUF2254 domain-containing protein [Thalassobacillus sp. CUG 92003]|uniref:DUF2254 domain-containing protein n=1 Tax=Thalassobacillus sp. CUG 92003 TaxID=2736641 RepID=UPI0015E758CB|nr:DUF2254 domain-containing protein [Thalassobacillus sp. CUG 92003]